MERTSKGLGGILTDEKNRLSDDSIENIIFLHTNFKFCTILSEDFIKKIYLRPKTKINNNNNNNK
jgi:hypothetical protein